MIEAPVFIDTGAFLARYVARDQYHADALIAWKSLETRPRRSFTSNFVLDETFTLLARRSSYAFAAERARALLGSRLLEVLRPSSDDELRVVDLFEKFADQKISFTDCVSFVLMKRRNIRHAFSFDRHFLFAGFDLWLGGVSTVHQPEAGYGS